LRGFSKFNENRIMLEANFLSSFYFPGVMWGPWQNLRPIGSAVLTSIEYKQSGNKHPDKPSILYIYS